MWQLCGVKNAVLIVLILLMSGSVYAGNDHREKKAARTISGKITDTYGETIPGAAVFVAELNQTIFTDMDGNFKLQIPADQNLQLSISTLGFEPVKLNSQQLGTFNEISLKSL